MTWQQQLDQWRFNRNIITPSTAYVDMMLEEIDEAKSSTNINELIDALADQIVLTYNQAKLEGKLIDIVDKRVMSLPISAYLSAYDFNSDNSRVFQNIYAGSYQAIYELGYNLDKVMLETVAEISSRVQDPIQAEEWSLNGPSGKWRKDLNQDPSTLYKADYSKCRA